MSETSTRQISEYRHAIADRWRQANTLSIELCLRAQENEDPGVMARIKAGFESAIAELEKSRSQLAV